VDFSDLSRLASGHVEARIVQTAVQLKIFDAIQKGSRNASSISASIRCDARATELLLNALVSLRLLKKKESQFSLNEISSTYLVGSSPQYFGAMILFESSLWDCWSALEKAVRSGGPVRTPDMYQGDTEETDRFIEAMHSLVRARGDAEYLTAKLDLSRVAELLDVGSGPGTYPIHFCRKYPALKATIFDLAGTMKVTERFVRASGLQERIKLVVGDYRADPIPGRYQLVFLCNIIHAESAEQNARLMAKLFSCLDQGGKIVIKDHILTDALTHPPVGALFSLLMLLTTERGRCYSFTEVKSWLGAAGFQQVAHTPLSPPLTSSLVIGEKY
jgi:predicted O-methyltransferase YrrM